MTVLSVLTFPEALDRKIPFWRLEITNWGNRQTGAASDGTSLNYPGSGAALESGAQLITIGPDSTADEVIVNYNPFLFNTAFTVPNPGFLNQLSMTVGLGRPGQMIPGAMSFRTALSTQFGDTYIKDGTTGNANFGTAPEFEAPTLQLLVYPQMPTVPVVAKRNLMYRSVSPVVVAGAEQLLAIWPVMGRSCKVVYFRATGTLAANVRVGLISSYVGTSAGVPVFRPVEDTAQTGAVSAATATQFRCATTTPCQWLAVYATLTGGAGSIVANLIASDDSCADTSTAS